MRRSQLGAPKGKTRKQDDRRSIDWVRLTVAVLFFGLGASLLTLAIPRSVAAITFARQSAAAAVTSGQRSPTPAELADGVKIMEDALRWAAPARYLFSLCVVEYRLALTFPIGTPGYVTWLGRAEQHAITALKANPAEGYGWVMLAVMRQARGAAARDVLDPLITSLDVAPNRRELWRSRMILLMYYWDELKPNELPTVLHQLRTMWDVPAFQFFLYDTALTYGRKVNLLQTLTGDPEAMQEIATFDRNMAYP
jgi:hypothetical protein